MNQKAISRTLGVAVLCVSSLALSGCGIGGAIGMKKRAPDEFEVVTKAPLVIPPDFSLHPPAPGQNIGPQTEADLIAQKAIIGDAQAFTAGMSPGERALVAKAGAAHADPLIRQVVDQEFGNLVRRSDEFSNRIIFWDAAQANAGTAGASPSKGADQVDGQTVPVIKK